MVDAHTVVRAFLLADGDLVALVDDRVYAGRDVPPVGYTPDDGPCVVFKVRGGAPDYPDALLNPSLQFKCYGSDEVEAYQTYRAVYDALQNGHNASILHAESEVLGQLLREPDTEWVYALAFFVVQIRQT